MAFCNRCNALLTPENWDPERRAIAAARSKAWRDANPERFAAYQAEYRKKNRAHLAADQRHRRAALRNPPEAPQ